MLCHGHHQLHGAGGTVNVLCLVHGRTLKKERRAVGGGVSFFLS